MEAELRGLQKSIALKIKKYVAVLTLVLADLPQSRVALGGDLCHPWQSQVARGVYVHHQRIRTVRRIKVGAWGAQPSVGGSRVPA